MIGQEHASSIRREGYPCTYLIKASFGILHCACPSFQINCWKFKLHIYSYLYTRNVSDKRGAFKL